MNEVVKSISVENMLRQRDAILERVEQAKKLIDEADAIGLAGGFGTISPHLSDRYGRHGGVSINQPDLMDRITKRVDSCGWNHLMRESGLRSFMDAKAREEWDKGVMEFTTPPLTANNVSSTFTMLRDGRGELFERGVIACFKRLSWSYKTNQPFKFGRRLVVSYVMHKQASNDKWTQNVNSSNANELDDLVRVFSVLDGKPEPDHRNGIYSQLTRAAHERQTFAELDYFTIKWFKNGNGHITFKRSDLVDKLNLILAKHYPNALASDVR